MKKMMVGLIIFGLGLLVVFIVRREAGEIEKEIELVALPDATKATLSDLIKLAQSLGTERKLKSSEIPLFVKIKNILVKKGASDKASWALAYSYVLEGDYKKGIEEYSAFLKREPMDASVQAQVHSGLGDVYYNLALLDMINRDLYSQAPIGFLMFHPDQRVVGILKVAKEEFDKAVSLDPSFAMKKNARIKQLNLYLSYTPSEIAVTEDQAQGAMWLMGLSSQKPQLMEVAKRTLDAFRLVMFLGQEPFIPDSLVSATRKQRFKEIDELKSDFGFQLKGIYDLACLTAAWIHTWGPYLVLVEKGEPISSGQKVMVKNIGRRILEGASLLGLKLPPEAEQHLKLKDHSQKGLGALFVSIEEQLKTQHSSSHRQLYVFVHTENLAVTYLNNPETFGRLTPKMVPRLLSTLNEIAQESGAAPAVQMRLAGLLKQTSLGKHTATEMLRIDNQIFSGMLAKFKKDK